MSEAYVYQALRTPRARGLPPKEGKAPPPFASLGPHDLVAQLVEALAERLGQSALDSVARLLLGCVGQVGAQGGHLALVSRLSSALSDQVSVKTINNYCVSGLSAVNEAVLWAQAGEGGLSLAGGVEMLSKVPFLADQADYYLKPELAGKLQWLSPIMGAELMATLENYSKEDLDQLTLDSHQKAARAWQGGYYATGVVPVFGQDGSVLAERDEWVQSTLSLEKLAAIPPAFAKIGQSGQDQVMLNRHPQLNEISHVHSLANTPGLSDGAALVAVGSKVAGERAGIAPKAKVLAIAEVAGDPIIQFEAGFLAMKQVLKKSGLELSRLDLIEFMEAFAAPPLKFLRNYQPDPEKVNVNGGHLAMGHPMGATGAILVTTLLHELERRQQSLGMVVALAAGGIGSAIVLERV